MAIILQRGHKALKERAREVSLDDIRSAKVRRIIANMKSALHTEADGVGLAAPQIGATLRIFIVARKMLSPQGASKDRESAGTDTDDVIFINPILIRKSKETALMEEGCLSVRPYYGLVRRSVRARVRAYDEQGKVFERGAVGILAQLFQHELDHLDGVLFSDKAESLEKVEKNVSTLPRIPR